MTAVFRRIVPAIVLALVLATASLGGIAEAAPVSQGAATPAPSASAAVAHAAPATAASSCRYVNCNPWGYNFTCCYRIYSPPSTFCRYFPCIASFWKIANGYVVECRDGRYSHSGGRSGACSYHRGVWRALLRR